MFLTEDESSRCRELGEFCENIPGEECCSGLECDFPNADRCCKPWGAKCSDSSECCGTRGGDSGYCRRGECDERPGSPDDDETTSLDANDQSIQALFLTEEEDSTCREIGETCGPDHPGCDWHYCSSWRRTCCLGPAMSCNSDSECCQTSDWSGLCIDGQCARN